MNNIKFTPKKGVLSNIITAAKASSQTLAYSTANAANGLRFLNHAISDGLALAEVAEEVGMAKASRLLSEALGKEVTVKDIRDGEVKNLVEEANKNERAYAAKKGQYKLAKREAKLEKKIQKLDRKIQKLKEETANKQ